MQLLVLLGVFFATIGVLYGGYAFLNRRSLAATEAALAQLEESDAAAAASRSILREERASELPLLDRALRDRPFTHRLAERLRRAGVSLTPANFLLRALIIPMGGLLVGRVVLATALGERIGAVIGVAIAAPLPWLWLRYKIQRRSRKFSEQLPEAIDMIVSAMRAGYSFQAAMKLVGEEVPDPLGPEFLRFYEEQRLGIEVRTALLAMLQRAPDLDLRMFITAVIIQRETGGNLTEVLQRLATLMREREGFRGELETLTAEAKLSARILGALPFVVFASLLALNPNFLRPVLETSLGPWALGAAALSVVVGYRIMMRIARVEF